MKTRLVSMALGAAFAAMLVPAGGHAAACNGTVTEIASPAGTVYIDDRGVDADGVWTYLESNGTPGLQSGGQSAVLGDQDVDACTDGGTPDTLIV